MLKNGTSPVSFGLFLFFLQTSITINKCENVHPVCIWYWDSNPRPSEHEPPPIIARLVLPGFVVLGFGRERLSQSTINVLTVCVEKTIIETSTKISFYEFCFSLFFFDISLRCHSFSQKILFQIFIHTFIKKVRIYDKKI